MAIITKIRDKSGWTAGIIVVALGLFIAGSGIFTGQGASNSQIVGTIDGKEIKTQDFSAVVEQLVNNYKSSTGRSPAEAQMPGIRLQAWGKFVENIAYQNEYNALGIEVTPSEIQDMVQGNNIHPGIAQAFKNPETGEIDRNQIAIFLSNIKEGKADGRAFANFEKQLYPERKRQKFEGLLSLSSYATKQQAKREYELQNTKYDFKFAFIPYTSVDDSLVTYTDSDLKAYYKSNSKKYERKANRAIEYVSFPITATPQDEKEIKEELASLTTRFQNSTNDTIFTEGNSSVSGLSNFKTFKPSDLPKGIAAEDLTETGKVFGPFKSGKSFKLYKLIALGEDTVLSARASHILFKEDDKATASKVLRELKNGADFAEMAKKHGTDGTKNKGGDLGWFSEGKMVAKFNDAVMKASKKGLLPRLIKTQFGYHIIEVTGTKTKQTFTLASIQKDITYSNDTYEVAYTKAGRFGQVQNRKEYNDAVTEGGLVSLQALTLAKDSRYVNNLNDASVRGLVRWAYNEDTEIGQISEVYEFNNQFVIAVLTGKRGKGAAPFNDVKADVEKDLKKEKQKEIILAKLEGVTGAVDAVTKNYGNGSSMQSLDDRSASNPSLPKAGYSPKAFGYMMNMKAGEISKPIEENKGIVIIELTKVVPALETADYTLYRTQLQDKESRLVAGKVKKAIEKYYDVENMLHKIY